MKKNIKTKLRRIFSLLVLISAIPFFSGCGTTNTVYSVSLEVWGPFDDSTAFADIISQYKKINPYIKDIKYKKFSVDTYKNELIDALAAGNGPDIFLINNSWLPSFLNKLAPAPVISQAVPASLVSIQNMRDNFPDTVLNDFTVDNYVYAVPLTVDSLQLYYNKDIFNSNAITLPPKTWKDFDNIVQKTTSINSVGDIVQSGAAIGTYRNINRPTDILNTLMMQYGVAFPMKAGVSAKIDKGVMGSDGSIIMGGEKALEYYTHFAKLTNDGGQPNPDYTWSDRSHYSVDAFTEGNLAMMLNYSWQIKAIQNKNSKLNFAVAPIPQLNPLRPVTNSNYWGFGVSLNKVAPQSSAIQGANAQVVQAAPNNVRIFEAWQFLRFLTLKNSGSIRLFNAYTRNFKDFPISFDPASDYLQKTGQPAARRDLIEFQKTDPLMGPFAAGNLIARNWWQSDSDQIELILDDAIQAVNRGNASIHDAIATAATKIDLIIRGK